MQLSQLDCDETNKISLITLLKTDLAIVLHVKTRVISGYGNERQICLCFCNVFMFVLVLFYATVALLVARVNSYSRHQ